MVHLPGRASPPSSRATRVLLFVSALLLMGLWFGLLEHRELFQPDEGRYAEIPREMLESGDWITPRLNGLKYFEKPALQYWATAAAYRVFGVDEWTARLWTALCGFMTLGFTALTARRFGGWRAGLLAAGALASSTLFLAFSQILTLDMGVTCFLTLSLCAWCGLLDDRLTDARRRTWAMVFWAALGLAMLSKGLIGVVLPAGVIGCHLALTRGWRALRHAHIGAGIGVFLCVCLPWFVLVSWRNPEFPYFFFIHEHFARYLNAGHQRPGPWWFFLAMILIGSLPWTPVYLRAFWAALREADWMARRPVDAVVGADRAPGVPDAEAPAAVPVDAAASGQALAQRIGAAQLLVLWVVLITGFFSASHSKLPAYILPVFPALAILLAGHAQARPIVNLLPWRTLACLGVVLLSLPWLAVRVTAIETLFQSAPGLSNWLSAAGIAMLVVAAATAVTARAGLRDRGALAACIFVLGTVAAQQGVLAAGQKVAGAYSAEAIVAKAEAAAQGFDTQAPFYSVGVYDQTLPVNLRRLLTLVAYSDEFAFGIAHEPGLALAQIQDFRARWQADRQAYALMSREVFAAEQAAGLPMFELAASPSHVIVARRAPEPGVHRPFLTPL